MDGRSLTCDRGGDLGTAVAPAVGLVVLRVRSMVFTRRIGATLSRITLRLMLPACCSLNGSLRNDSGLHRMLWT
ncbi:MAG TPA: hypothetical protein PLC79_10240, partial [Phycisphaerae bacterium]|nr:hypothetical protein [Phycisphaerae bacterium]